MRRLFKEVFKSLAKNKVTLICLTILIFLTTFLFTLLNDVKTSYSRTINSYDKVSRLHDLTVDLDINPSGIIPRHGYNQIDKDNLTITNKPIKFESSKNGSMISYTINLSKDNQQYVNIVDNIENWNADSSYYISTVDLMSLYYEELKSEITSVQFEINKKNPDPSKIREFSFAGANRKFQVYKKLNGKIVPITQNYKILSTNNIKFKSTFKLGDIFSISYGPKGPFGQQVIKDSIIESSPLFINTLTKEASFLTSDYDEWKAQNVLAIIKSEDVLDLLGFEKETKSNKWHFNETKYATSPLKIAGDKKTTDFNINNNDILKSEFQLGTFANKFNLETNSPLYIDLESNKTYKLHKDWIRKTEQNITYNWYRFVLNWNEDLNEDKSNWKGSYFKYINDFFKNKPDEYKKNLYFSYWDKTITTKYSIGDKYTQTIVQTKPLEKNDVIGDNGNFKTYWMGGNKNNNHIPPNKIGEPRKLWNIKQIEFNKNSTEELTDEEFLDISNVEKLNQYQAIIRNGAINFARTSILKDIENSVGKENIGIRKTVTVETVNEDNGKKNVFHFVDMGDRQRKILGIENNVGKLYNETLNPGLLHKSISDDNVNKFILKPKPNSTDIEKIPSVYTHEIIDLIFHNFTPNINYFNADIRFENYYDFLSNTRIPYLTNGKILLLTIASTEKKTSSGSTIVGAIAMPKPGKYIFLKRSSIEGFSSEIVWNKVLINDKEYLSLDEVYNYCVSQDYTIRGDIGPNGWAMVNPQFKNSISLPVSFGSISNDLTQEIIQKNTIKKLAERARSVFIDTDFAKLFDKNDIYRLFKAISDSIEANNLHSLLAIGKTNQFILEKTILDVIKYLVKPIDQGNNKNLEFTNVNANSFFHNFFNNILGYFKKQYLNSGTTEEERDAYLIKEINKLSGLLGFSKIYIIPQLNLSLSDLLSLIKNKAKIFDILSEIISSIDFIKFSSTIDSWYAKHPYKPFTSINDTYWSMAHERMFISLLSSVNENKFKNGIKTLINQVDFSKILNPDYTNSYYAKWISAYQFSEENLSDETKVHAKKFFKALDAKKDGSYSNINEGLFKIISNINIEKFTESLSSLIKEVKYSITANNKIYNDYNTEYLSQTDILAAFMSSLNSSSKGEISSGKVNQIQNALILMLNLSNKTSNIIQDLNITFPTPEEGKISLLDLAIIPKLAFPKTLKNSASNSSINLPINRYDLSDIQKIILKIETSINQKTTIKLTANEYKFITEQALINEVELNNLEELKSKLIKYYNFVQKLQLKSFKKENGIYDFKVSNLNNINPETYGDLAYYSALLNENDPSNQDKIKVLKTIYTLLAENFATLFMNKGQDDIINNHFILYSLWIKFAYFLNRLGDVKEKIIIDKSTGNKILQKEYEKILTYSQIKFVLKEIYKLSQEPEFIKILQNYNNVVNPIPSMGVLGSDSEYRATLLKISYAHAHTNLANREVIKLLENSNAFNTFSNNLESSGISNSIVKKIQKLLIKNSNEITYNFGYIASASQMSTFYNKSLKMFLNSFIKSEGDGDIKALINDDYDLDVAYKMAIENSALINKLSLINIPKNLLNPLTIMSFPQILLYYTLSPDPNQGNLAYIVKKMLNNLKLSNVKDITYQIEALTQVFESSTKFIESKNDSSVDLDISKFNHIFNKLLRDTNGNELEIFGINITKSMKKALFKVIEPIQIANLISYSDTGSYLAKVNYGYASKNNKEAYTGDISKYLSNPYAMKLFISSLDDKYKIKINTQEYLIIGIDSTADYLYPVVNEENIQVDTTTQAIVYVNSKGFDRIYSAYPTFALKTYALVQAPRDAKNRFLPGKSPLELQSKFIKEIEKINPNSFKKVYLQDELDNINPERKIRITTIRSIVNSIKNATVYLISVLTVLVAFIVYFIIKRYIEARNKVVGILRAQGYTTPKIAFAFCAFGWIPAAVGGILGYILGFALQKPAMGVLSSYWTLENNIIPLHAFSMLSTILVPLLFVSLLIFIITSLLVRKKPIELMSGLTELNVGNFAQRVSSMFRKLPIKTRFIASMALNNFWKMFSLFLAFSTTSLISMFFLSSNNIFNKAITKTYKDRLYRYKLDLESPTTEGGPYVTYNKNDINSLLYVPNDLAGSSSNGSQLDYNNPNFLRPGGSFNTDIVHRPYNPVVLTKSSLDLLLDLSVEISPWDITYANMPETQRARVSQIFKRVSLEMQNTQYLIDIAKVRAGQKDYMDTRYSSVDNIIAVRDLKKFQKDLADKKPEDISNRISFFYFTHSSTYNMYEEQRIAEQFKFVEWDPNNEVYYKPKIVSTSRFRQEYRNFLVNAYKNVQSLDFFVSFGGVYWNDTTNEKYTYAKALLDGKETRIYGYYNDSKFISMHDDKGNDLQKRLNNYEYNETTNIPLIINTVTQKKYNLKIGSVIEVDLLNHVDRFSYRALNQKAPKTKYNFEVIGISETYINSELTTRKDILDKILGYDTLSKRLKDSRIKELQNVLLLYPDKKEEIQKAFDRKYDAFNGVLSNDKTPVQTIDTLTTYSSTGFWGAASSFEVDGASDQAVWEFFKRIFISNKDLKYKSVYENNIDAYNEAHPGTNLKYKEVLFKLLNINEIQFQKIVKEPNANEEFKQIARKTVTDFYGVQSNTIYGKNIMYGASFDVNSKDIEAGFISGISNTVNTILVTFIIMSLTISIIILIVITNIMIASNKRAIAIFSVLGYTNREKTILFFANFVPAIILACLFMIPATLLLISIFNAFMMATSQIVLPLVLNYSTIIISATICLAVFILTSMATWKSLNKVKAVDALKGK
ncbi:FtsX-like permease family protein [Metamycoplasma phocicerebrale]|uniref:FtsX-like permease family protein n=1 Tax=Metamycoplasma phocicerebrale TaxID=142649 RepID=A0A3Q9V9F0_9BACT|nr:ABC transporter permease [Metamycoplasma phocicerebrale]AZZ65638.2 FtsX-like permease family protein [Metamycoplasma phocicerebrale]